MDPMKAQLSLGDHPVVPSLVKSRWTRRFAVCFSSCVREHRLRTTTLPEASRAHQVKYRLTQINSDRV